MLEIGLYKDSMKDALYDGLFQSVDQRFSMNDVSKSFHECVKLIILDDGPLTLK